MGKTKILLCDAISVGQALRSPAHSPTELVTVPVPPAIPCGRQDIPAAAPSPLLRPWLLPIQLGAHRLLPSPVIYSAACCRRWQGCAVPAQAEHSIKPVHKHRGQRGTCPDNGNKQNQGSSGCRRQREAETRLCQGRGALQGQDPLRVFINGTNDGLEMCLKTPT